MEVQYIWCFIHMVNVIYGFSDSESTESNRIEVRPFYDTVIYSDIADIINDFENNGVSPSDVFTNDDSQSDEKIEDLLTEYQHYLEKAHKQRINYVEKSKTKNKVPLVRHDKFSKTKPSEFKHKEYYYPNGFYNPSFKIAQSSYNNPLDLFIPINSKGKFIHKVDITTSSPKEIRNDFPPFEKIFFNDKNMLDLLPTMQKSSFDSIKSTCFCRNDHVPCDCNCKECLVHVETLPRQKPLNLHLPEEPKKIGNLHSLVYNNSIKNIDQVMDNNTKDWLDNTLNIRIKVNLKFPKLLDNFVQYYKTHNHGKIIESDDAISKELNTAIKLPLPYFNFPVPMQFLGYNLASRHNKDVSMPMHKITIQKKKKSRSNSNKKHRKKIITFHNFNLEKQSLFPIRDNDNISDTLKDNNTNNIFNDTKVQLELLTINKTDGFFNDTQTEESISLMVNITNNNYSNTTEESHKSENSIETDYTSTRFFMNTTTISPKLRKKRDVSNINNSDRGNDTVLMKIVKANITKDKNNIKRSDKNLLTDAELLYWPNAKRNSTYVSKKNITSIILENDHKKSKLNLSKESIRQNHTRALEQAIFGEVDWDDIDTIAPAFMSFVGKYVCGILTFCSERVCHSMKCGNKTCLHRVCIPTDRLNNKGHCAASNSTDSVASMESIMDLPSNIAFELVDILQTKMLGKIFGKATLCINSKCVTLVASKKSFVKNRCTMKDLTTTGHCSNAKTVKVM